MRKNERQWPVSCERDSFSKGKKSLLQRRKTALPGWRVERDGDFALKERKFLLT
jgi:hypothetical protein